jgi:hypothetical protein
MFIIVLTMPVAGSLSHCHHLKLTVTEVEEKLRKLTNNILSVCILIMFPQIMLNL